MRGGLRPALWMRPQSGALPPARVGRPRAPRVRGSAAVRSPADCLQERPTRPRPTTRAIASRRVPTYRTCHPTHALPILALCEGFGRTWGPCCGDPRSQVFCLPGKPIRACTPAPCPRGTLTRSPGPSVLSDALKSGSRDPDSLSPHRGHGIPIIFGPLTSFGDHARCSTMTALSENARTGEKRVRQTEASPARDVGAVRRQPCHRGVVVTRQAVVASVFGPTTGG